VSKSPEGASERCFRSFRGDDLPSELRSSVRKEREEEEEEKKESPYPL
jgi:hypothetical protein